MSRSYRKPYRYVVPCGPVKPDRTIAARAVRRRHHIELHEVVRFEEFEDVLLSHKHDCPYNDKWGWNCDGNTVYESGEPDRYHKTWVGVYLSSDLDAITGKYGNKDNRHWLNYHLHFFDRAKKIHEKLKRK